METKPEVKKLQLIYIGRRLGADGKLSYLFKKIIDETAEAYEEDGMAFDLKHPPLHSIGVYEVDSPREGSIYSKSFRWLRPWSDTAKVAEWEAASRGNEREWESVRLAKSEKNKGLDAAMEPLVKIYRKLSPFQRSAFIVMVVDKLRRMT